MKNFSIIILASFVFTVSGCGGGAPARPEGQPVRGVVTWEGKPLQSGEIELSPDLEMDNVGPTARAPIVNGQYETQPGRGVSAGHVDVRITIHGDTVAAGPDVPVEEQAAKEVIGICLQRIEVKEGDNVADFDLTKANLRKEEDN